MTDPDTNHDAQLHGEAGRVSVACGQVMLDGPDGVAVAMTPDAAAETGRRLIAAAAAALDGDHMG